MPTSVKGRGSNPKASRTISTLLLAILGAFFVGSASGYLVGNHNNTYSFSQPQLDFIDGVVAGTTYRSDYEDWRDEGGKDKTDPRSNPALRCAGDFYPGNTMAMSGCIIALKGRPPNGYQLPGKR